MVERNMSNAVRRGIVVPPGSRATSRAQGTRIASEPGISRVWPSPADADGPHREGEEPKPMMHGHEKSGDAIVAVKPTNKAERSAAEPVEPRAEAKGNAGQQNTHRAQYRVRVAKALACIRRIIAVDTRGGSRMRESRTYGSGRGARGNSRPYRESYCCGA